MTSSKGAFAFGVVGLSTLLCATTLIRTRSVSAEAVGKKAGKNGLAEAEDKKISWSGERGNMSKDAFGMASEDYFTSPFKNFNNVGDRLVDQGFEGLIIGGPEYFPIGKGDRLPVVALRVAESMESSRHLFNEYTLITAMDLSSNVLYANDFVERKSVKRERDLEKDPPPPGKVTDGGATNLFSSLGLPRRIGEYLVMAILLDKASNRIQVRVGPSDLETEKEHFLETLLKSRQNIERKGRRVAREKSILFGQDPKSPAVPEAPGIVLKAEHQWKEKEIPEIVTLYGSYKLPGLQIGKNGPTPASREAKITTVPLSLLITGTRVPTAIVLEMDIPIPESAQDIKSKFLEGYFTVPIGRSDGLEGNQTYYIRAFSGSSASDPAQATLPTK